MDEKSQPQPNNSEPEFTNSAEEQAALIELAQTEAVLQAWATGTTSEALAPRFGANWSEIEGQAKLSRAAQQAGAQFRQSVPTFDKAAMWARISSELPAAQISAIPSADSNNAVTPTTATPKLRVLPPTTTNNSKSSGRKNAWLNRVSWPARIAAAIVIFFVVSAGFATAAQAASPGDFLYGAKVALDRSGEVFAFTPDAKAQAALNFCQHRLQEMQDLVQKGRYDLLPEVTSNYLSGLQDVQNATKQLPSSLSQQLDAQRSQFQVLQQQAVPPTVQNNLNEVITTINLVKATSTAPATTTITIVTSTPTNIVMPTVTPLPMTSAASNANSQPSTTPSPDDNSVDTTSQSGTTASVSVTNSPAPDDTTTGVATNPPAPETTDAPENTPTIGEDTTTVPVVVATPTPANTTIPAEPTDAPKPTHTPKPTNTPKPTEQPKPTATPEPTDTTVPSRPTVIPKPTDTTVPPRPTVIPKPTDTTLPPRPTINPKPTDTPRPVDTTVPPKPTQPPKPTKVPEPTDLPKPTKAPEPTEPPKPPKSTKAPDPPKPTKPPKTTKADGSTSPASQTTLTFDQLIIWDNKPE